MVARSTGCGTYLLQPLIATSRRECPGDEVAVLMTQRFNCMGSWSRRISASAMRQKLIFDEDGDSQRPCSLAAKCSTYIPARRQRRHTRMIVNDGPFKRARLIMPTEAAHENAQKDTDNFLSEALS